jgi:hypothetical protein
LGAQDFAVQVVALDVADHDREGGK